MTDRTLRDVVRWIRLHGPIPVRRIGVADQLHYVVIEYDCHSLARVAISQSHKTVCHEAFVQAAGGLPDVAGGPGELSPSDLAAVAAWVRARRAENVAVGWTSTSYGELFWLDHKGRRHRDDGPAAVYCDGRQEWRRHGELHREDGPAIVCPGKGQEWYRDGRRHREDGPAVEYLNGFREWWRDGELHRDDGPAVIRPDGTRKWYRNSKLHREDGPAVKFPNGAYEWWLDGKLHRNGGPAVRRADGTREWWCEDRRHREDGPAVEYADGTCEWWYNGERVDPLEVLVRAGETAGKEGAA